MFPPHYTFPTLLRLIDNEIINKQKGKQARIQLKLNNVTNNAIISKLYEASRAGVQIDMIVRGVCCLIPGVEGMSENIRVISIVDKFLEHPRIYVFENDGSPKMYISSADWMTRNIDNRIEVACPILDKNLQQELLDTFMISWNDNVKARLVNTADQNAFVQSKGELISFLNGLLMIILAINFPNENRTLCRYRYRFKCSSGAYLQCNQFKNEIAKVHEELHGACTYSFGRRLVYGG